MSLGFKRLIP